MRVRSRRRFVRRLVALGWFVTLTFGGCVASTAWWPDVVHRVQLAVDAETFDKVVRGAAIGAGVAAGLLMTRWSWRQLRGGGLSRLVAAFRKHDE